MGLNDRAPRRAWKRLVALAATLACAVGVLIPTASAVPMGSDPGTEKKQVDKKINSLESDIDDTSAALKSAYDKLQATKAQLPGAQAALTQAQSAVEAADLRAAQAAQDLQVARANADKAAAELSSTKTAVADGHTRIAQFAAQIYQEQGLGQLDVAMSSTDPQQFANRLALVDTVMDVQGQGLAELAAQQASLAALQDHLTALRADADQKKQAADAALVAANTARDAAAAAKQRLDDLAAAQTAQAADFETQLAEDKQALAEMKKRQAALSAELKRLAEEARKKRAAEEAARKKAAEEAARKAAAAAGGSSSGGSSSGGSSSGSGNVAPSGTRFASRPVRTGWVSSEFGMRFHPILHYWRLHAGRDYAVACGTPVYAAASGTVIQAYYDAGYGNRIVIDNGLIGNDGFATTYNHLSQFVVTGGHVNRGQLIAYSGTTGTSTGCHLHFEILKDGVYVDPRGYLTTLG